MIASRPNPVFAKHFGVTQCPNRCWSTILTHGVLVILTIGIPHDGNKSGAANGGTGSSVRTSRFRGRVQIRPDTFWKVDCHFTSRVAVTSCLQIYISLTIITAVFS
jgi:hypothetical protein